MKCPGCGQVGSETAAFCAACGTVLSASRAVASGDATLPTRGLPESTDAPTQGLPVDDVDAPTRVTSLTGRAYAPISGPPELQPGARLGERYEIVAVLGIGGMGVVYRARDLKLDRDVALKVIRPDLLIHPEVLERFHREILLSSRVTHRHILRIHDLAETDGLSYISMQFVEGETLADRLTREGPLPPDDVVRLGVQMCEALQAAHDAGVVHRDLKPQNILIDTAGQTYIADFGISRSLEQGGTMTEHGAVIGTLDYMSPEQARGETADHRSDIYSLGLVLHKMLTGRLPFDTGSSITTVLKRAQEEIPDLRRAKADVPAWLGAIIARSLRRDRAERYASADALRRDLLRRAATRQLRLRWVSRLAAAIAIVALLVAGAFAGLRWWGSRATSGPVVARASLALLPFVNVTREQRDDWARAGLPDLMRTDLLQSRELRLAGADRVAGVLGGMKLESGGELRADSVPLVAGLLGVDHVLTGSIMRAGEVLRIEATLQQVVGSSVGSSTPLRVEGAGDDALFVMVDELARQVRERLGVARRWGERDRGVDELSTSSVEALRLYTEGRLLDREGKDQDASRLLEQAIERDPAFVAARARLAELYTRMGYADRATEQARLAVDALKPDTSTYEAARIRGVKARLDGDLDAALVVYGEITDNAPNDAEGWVDLAAVLEERGDLKEAQAKLERAIELDPKHPNAHFVLGRVHVKLGNADEALSELDTALKLHTETNNDEGRAAALAGLGNVYYRQGKANEAVRAYEDALTLREQIGDLRGVRVSLSNIAILLRDQGRFAEAEAKADRALVLSREMGDVRGEAEGLAIRGDIHSYAGRPELALNDFQASLRLSQEIGDSAILAQNLGSLGYINSVLGRYAEAVFFLREALSKREAIGSKPEILRSLIDLGAVEQILGRYDDAIKHYGEGLQLAQEVNDEAGLTVLRANLGDVRRDQGDYSAALALLDEATKGAERLNDAALLVICRIYRGATLARLGDLPTAVTELDAALAQARGLKQAALIAEAQVWRAETQFGLGDLSGARSAAREAIDQADRSQDQRLVLMARAISATVAADRAALERAVADLDRAGLEPLAAATRLPWARALFAAGQAPAALREAQRAATIATKLRAKDLLFQAQHLVARAQAGPVQAAESQAAYTAALGALESLRQQLERPLLAVLLSRPQTAAFAAEARGVDADRLARALAVEESP